MNRDESGLLRALLQEGLLTAAQGKRVARAIDRGASLEEALGRTPLIDPLDYHKVIRESAPAESLPPRETFTVPDRESLRDLAPMATYDLGEDEGIPLIQRLYELLGEVFYGGMSGLEIGRERMESGWSKVFDTRGECLETCSLEASQAEKMMARLRVMGRIAPSRKTHQRSLVVLKGNGLQAEALVESQGDLLRVILYRDLVGNRD